VKIADLVRRTPRSAYRITEKLLELRRRFYGPGVTHPARPRGLTLEPLETRDLPSPPGQPDPMVFVGSGPGAAPLVRAFNIDTGIQTFEQQAYDAAFTGGVNVATADLTGDGFPDLVVAPGPGGGPNVRVFDGTTGNQIAGPLGSFWAYDPSFTGGVSVTAADINGDGTPDIVTGAWTGGGPNIRVFSGTDGSMLASFYAYDPDFTGGVSVAAADFDHDGKSEIVVGAGPGGGPHVKIFTLASGTPQVLSGPLGSFFAYEDSFRGGVNVAADNVSGDFDGDCPPFRIVCHFQC
jgi:hypothetical protein